MKKNVLILAVISGVVLTALKVLEYQFINRDLSVEVYILILVSIALVLGLWFGRSFFKKEKVVVKDAGNSEISKEALLNFGLSPREIEILELIDQGYTNQKIADTLFVSLSTVKTHTSNLYSKLDVNNRVQALLKAKDIDNQH